MTEQLHHSQVSTSLGLGNLSLEVSFLLFPLAMGKTSDSYLCSFKELRPTKKGSLQLSPNLLSKGSDLSGKEAQTTEMEAEDKST